jgi:hypothetical protein
MSSINPVFSYLWDKSSIKNQWHFPKKEFLVYKYVKVQVNLNVLVTQENDFIYNIFDSTFGAIRNTSLNFL